ncbi:hypothetical protein H8356DRAFT_1335938, partial [Neocallimastix lanati (nom. inval.)]
MDNKSGDDNERGEGESFLKIKKLNIQSTNKYTDEIQKYIIPYANNYFPDYKSTNEMENSKNEIYRRNKIAGSINMKVFG